MVTLDNYFPGLADGLNNLKIRELTEDNYFSTDANRRWMSASQLKQFLTSSDIFVLAEPVSNLVDDFVIFLEHHIQTVIAHK